MTAQDERPVVYDYLSPIVDAVWDHLPVMSRQDVEAVVGPPGADVLLGAMCTTLHMLGDYIEKEFAGMGDDELVKRIASVARNFLELPDEEDGT